MKQSRSEFIDVRGLKYHCRIWGADSAPTLFILHGWMDVSASFQFMVDCLKKEWRVIAPDWRGFGQTEWTRADSYWFPDYLADLDLILRHYAPDAPVTLAGHSLGGNVASLYAGVRPARVARFINLEGFGLTASSPEKAPERYAQWLDGHVDGKGLRDYENFEALAERLRSANPRLTEERSLFLARHWGGLKDGRVSLRADPRHKLVNPILYRLEEARACWRAVTAQTLWITGRQTKFMRFDEAEHESRKACFRHLTARVIDDCGHMLHHDQPAELARLIEDWLSKTPPTPA